MFNTIEGNIDMLVLKTLEDAENFVNRQKAAGNDVEFNGWDIVFYRPAPQGIYSKDGIFKDGQWGFRNVSPLQDNGTWLVDYRNIKRVSSHRD